MIRAVEFFSGIGAFAYASRSAVLPIKVVAAFDQGQDANRVYAHNFDIQPNSRNLDGIGASEIPDADLWWMSPPCTPYTIRGAQRDHQDSRAASLNNLLSRVSDKLPGLVVVENVAAFKQSHMHEILMSTMLEHGYQITEQSMCPTQFGIPMKRPRIFIIAARAPFSFKLAVEHSTETQDLSSFLLDEDPINLAVPWADLSRHRQGMHIVAGNEPYVICFTSGYGKSYRASGSFILQAGGVRRFAPEEMLRLFGFDQDFQFPADMDLKTRWRLIGNSVDVRCIRRILASVEAGR